MTNRDIFEAFHNTLLESGKDNNTFHIFNEDKTALIIYTESDPSNINRMLIEREGGDKYIDIDKVKQAREEIKEKAFTDEIFDEDVFNSTYTDSTSQQTAECESWIEAEVVRMNDVLEILDKLIAESE